MQDGGRFCSACGHRLDSVAVRDEAPAAHPRDPLTDPLFGPLSDPLTDPLTESGPAERPDPAPSAAPTVPTAPTEPTRPVAPIEPAEPAEELDPTVTRVRGIAPVPPPTTPPAATPAGPTGPPPPIPPPNSARYPLFADELHHSAEPAEPASAPEQTPPDPPEEQIEDGDYAAGPITFSAGRKDEERVGGRRRTAWVLWLVIGLLCAVVLLIGLWLLLGGGNDPERANATSPTSAPAEGSDASDEATGAEENDSPAPSRSPLGGEEHDVAASAGASAPATAGPGTDVSGDTVSYGADNLVDGDIHSAWRMAGDGTGTVLTLTLDAPTTLTEVGLVNGYDKTSREGGRTLDWYAGNRRVRAVEWEFDDGRTVQQDLADARAMQTVSVPDYTTQTLTLRLLEVSEPGSGAAARDYTAVSEVSLTGRTG
ncbi:NADase-type glycan-binding domain-containing protein [Nocardioides insulae]|uniref:NADase-type glycan-binding domain-containing protein n=1 Tax=Nocardioides insulae TaxID=394734 RepID=UPI0004265732|nr:hypothetical protein [Nocardioides insulae]